MRVAYDAQADPFGAMRVEAIARVVVVPVVFMEPIEVCALEGSGCGALKHPCSRCCKGSLMQRQFVA